VDIAADTAAGTLDLLAGDLYAGDPEPVYAHLRTEHPVYRDDVNALWGITRYHDIVEIEKDPATWCNTGGYRPNIPADPSIIGLDDPAHKQRRMLVARRFTPRAVTGHEELVRTVVTELIDAVAERADAEVVRDLAAPLPAKMIGHLLGFPDDAWPDLAYWSESTIVLGGGPRYFDEEGVASAMNFAGASVGIADERRGCPVDDGAETTRTVIATGIDTLIRHPDQLELLRREPDRIPIAVEELIRWTTPVLNMCRVATRDTEIGGVKIAEGDQVLLMYGAANRDEDVFEQPQRFDVTRDPNPHIAFGFGTHFCLGAALARLEIKVMFEELTRRFDSWSFTDDIGARRLPNAFVRGITELPVTFAAS
jgi:cytochrome P450 family 142 subfamily A polypeptide 1